MPIAPWLYTLGVARFAVQHVDDFRGKPIQTWVYAQDRDAGFPDFAVPSRARAGVLHASAIGPFAYQKLANVQSNGVRRRHGSRVAPSSTARTSVTGSAQRSLCATSSSTRSRTSGWATPSPSRDWDDVWLSEGFATYFTLLFKEHAYGHDEFVARARSTRGKRVFDFDAKNPDYRIVHDNLADMTKVTTSQHLPEGRVGAAHAARPGGDDVFWQGHPRYYAEFMNGNATTADFRRAMEAASGRRLGRSSTSGCDGAACRR